MLRELAGLCIPGQPIQVYNASTGTVQPMYIILASLMADSPGRQKVTVCGTASAYFCCQWCILQSKAKPGGMYRYPGGYLQPMTTDKILALPAIMESRGKKRRKHLTAVSGSKKIKLSDSEQA